MSIAYEQVTVSSTAKELTASAWATGPWSSGETLVARIQVQDADIRYRCDGTNPTTTAGTLVTNGESFYIVGVDDATTFRAIRTASTDAKLNVEYFRVTDLGGLL